MTLVQRFVSSRYLLSTTITSSIYEHPVSRETERNDKKTSADDGIDLDSIPMSATV